jgi:conjugal transfer pilus assembly protein TraF
MMQAVVWAETVSFYQDHERGWHWYEKMPEKGMENDDENNPVSQMDTIRATVKQALDKAILEPTPENVKNYIALQNDVADRSATFSKKWQEVLLENPKLDYSLVHPTNSVARQIEVDQQNQKENDAIKRLAQESGLFFFYKSTCPYCRSFAPILKRFASTHGIAVIPITTDGISLPEFPDSYSDQGQAATFEVKVEPSLFIVNTYTKKAIPVGYGLMSETDLRKRILDIANQMKRGSV